MWGWKSQLPEGGCAVVSRAEEFEAQDDDAALMAAEMVRKGPRMELWQRDRLVKRWT